MKSSDFEIVIKIIYSLSCLLNDKSDCRGKLRYIGYVIWKIIGTRQINWKFSRTDQKTYSHFILLLSHKTYQDLVFLTCTVSFLVLSFIKIQIQISTQHDIATLQYVRYSLQLTGNKTKQIYIQNLMFLNNGYICLKIWP